MFESVCVVKCACMDVCPCIHGCCSVRVRVYACVSMRQAYMCECECACMETKRSRAVSAVCRPEDDIPDTKIHTLACKHHEM